MREDSARSGEFLPTVDRLEIMAEPFRAFMPTGTRGPRCATDNPRGYRYLCYNFLLWKIPDFEHLLPTLSKSGGAGR